jgi:hypothetical protein
MEYLHNNILIGIPIADAIGIVEKYHLIYRIVCNDGNYYVVTRDFNKNRINFTIEKGVVVDAASG